MANKDHINTVATEFTGDEKKLINKIANDGALSFAASNEFKDKLDSKLQEKIKLTKEQREEKAAIDAVPKSLKWRFYLTGYGYAVVSFLVLFLIGFCTNIFTGTLKIPAKYTYLEENQAFGNLERGGELAYRYDVNSASNFQYYDDYDENIESEELTVDISSQSTNSLMAKTETLGTVMNAAEKFLADKGEEASVDGIDIFLGDGFAYDKTYRFAYKDKLFPKFNSEYPIYKPTGILMGSNTPNQFLKNLKIGDVSFRNFQDLEIRTFEIEQDVDNGYDIFFDSRNFKLYFYPNSSRKASEYLGKLPSNKQVIKNVEKDLKNLGVSLKNYGEGVVGQEDFDDNMGIIQIFYPFLIQGKTVRNAQGNSQIGMQVAYDLNLQKVVSVVGIDIATYDVSNYPTLEKNIIKSGIEQGGEYYNQGALHEDSTVILFDSMEVVYVEKIVNGETIYVPAIRSTVSTSLDDYTGPSTVYEEII